MAHNRYLDNALIPQFDYIFFFCHMENDKHGNNNNDKR